MNGQGIYPDFNPRSRKSINFGYIVVPSDVDRDAFILKCYNENRVSVFVEYGGGLINNCRITKEALANVEFPDSGNILGSMVCFFSEPFGNQVFVIGTLPKVEEVNRTKEGVREISSKSTNGIASISLDSEGRVNIDINSSLPNSGKLNININNKQNSAELNLNLKGNANLNISGDLNINTVDGNININCDNKVSINSYKCVLNEGTEAALLGNKTEAELSKEKQALTDLINAIKNLTINPDSMGGIDPTWFALQIALQQIQQRADYSEIKSENLFLK